MRAMQSFVESCTENVSYLSERDHVMKQPSGLFLDCLRLLDLDHSATNNSDLIADATTVGVLDPFGKLPYETIYLCTGITHDIPNKSPRSVMR